MKHYNPNPCLSRRMVLFYNTRFEAAIYEMFRDNFY